MHWAPGFPCALCFRGEEFMHNPGASRRGNVDVCLRQPFGAFGCHAADSRFAAAVERVYRSGIGKKKARRERDNESEAA